MQLRVQDGGSKVNSILPEARLDSTCQLVSSIFHNVAYTPTSCVSSIPSWGHQTHHRNIGRPNRAPFTSCSQRPLVVGHHLHGELRHQLLQLPRQPLRQLRKQRGAPAQHHIPPFHARRHAAERLRFGAETAGGIPRQRCFGTTALCGWLDMEFRGGPRPQSGYRDDRRGDERRGRRGHLPQAFLLFVMDIWQNLLQHILLHGGFTAKACVQ